MSSSINKREPLEYQPIDWNEASKAFSAPKGLGLFERYWLWHRGRKDARRRQTYITNEGVLTSPYLDALAHEINLGIVDEWSRCNNVSFGLRTNLTQIQRRREALLQRYSMLVPEREEALAHAREQKHIGDTVVSTYLATKRQERREAPIYAQYQNSEQRITQEIQQLALEAVSCLERLREAEDIARSHEQAHRHLFLWKMSAYAYGASSYLNITPEMINDSAITSQPSNEHQEWFGQLAELIDAQSVPDSTR